MQDDSSSLNQKIALGHIGVVTFVAAIIIGIKMGVRRRYILYLLVGIELAIYYGVRWLIEQIKK